MKELILYVAELSQDDPNFGAVKLNKILFYSDFLSYFRRGRSITDQDYFALDEGPAPKSLVPIRERMVADEDIAIKRVDRFGLPQHRVEALRQPDFTQLDAEDIAIATIVVEALRRKNGKEVTEDSHRFAGYKAAFSKAKKTTIPYATVRFDPAGFLEPLGITNYEMPSLPKKLVDFGHQLQKELESKS